MHTCQVLCLCFSIIVVVGDGWGQSVHSFVQQHPGPPWSRDDFWVSSKQTSPVPSALKEVKDILCKDLDGDGVLDRLYAGIHGLTIEWGLKVPERWSPASHLSFEHLPGELEEFLVHAAPQPQFQKRTPWSMQGDLNEGSRRIGFWVRWGGPERLLGFCVQKNRQISVEVEIPLAPNAHVNATEHGVIFGPDEEGKIYLQEHGVRQVLSTDTPPLWYLDFKDVDQNGERDLIVRKKSGAFGIALRKEGKMSGVTWLRGSQSMDEGIWVQNPVTHKQSLVGWHEGLQCGVEWKIEDGDWTMEACPDADVFGYCSVIKSCESAGGMMVVIAFRQESREMIGTIWDGANCTAKIDLGMMDGGAHPLLADINGDGLLDLVFYNEKSEELNIYFLLQESIHAGAMGRNLELNLNAFKTPDEWAQVLDGFMKFLPLREARAFADALPDTALLHAVQFNGRALEVCTEIASYQFEPTTSGVIASHHSTSERIADFEPSTRPFLIPSCFASLERSTFPMVSVGEWTHVVFQRTSDGTLELFVNGRKLIQEREIAMNTNYRILTLGAEGGNQPGRHFRGLLDEVEVIGAALNEEEIRARYQKEHVLGHFQTHMLLDFDATSGRRYDMGTHDLDMVNGASVQPGIHGSALRTGEQNGCGMVFLDFPSSDFTISFWAKADEWIDQEPQTILSLYGDENFNIDLSWGSEKVLREKAPLKLEVVADEKPEAGSMFRVGAQKYCLARSGVLYEQSGLAWEEIHIPLDKSGSFKGQVIGHPWMEAGQVHAIFQDNLEHWVLDLYDMTWSFAGSVHTALRDFDAAIHGDLGVLFVNYAENGVLQNAHWLAHGEDWLKPVVVPDPEDSIVGVLNPTGVFHWIHASGEQTAVRLSSEFPPVPFHGNSIPHWAVLASGLLALISIGTWVKRKNEHRATGNVMRGPEGVSGSLGLEENYISTELMERLKAMEGQVLDVPNLDSTLQIDHIETSETLRSRRARIIREVNEWHASKGGGVLIERIVDETDRRRRLYRIHPFAAQGSRLQS